MVIDDASVLAYQGCRDLLRLYDAHRATSQAQQAVIERLRVQLDPVDDAEVLAKLAAEHAHAQHLDAVMAHRSDQLRRRLLELLDLPEPT